MTSDAPRFQYAPLTEPDSLRILELLPSPDASAPLEVNLIDTTLSKIDYDLIGFYTALSYVWGDASLQQPILVNGKFSTITASLAAALHSLRDATRPRRMWADALCINEEDTPERNAQVSRMDRIYRLAMNTVIYLTSDLTPERNEIFQAVISSTQHGPPSSETLDSVIKLAETHLLQLPWFRRTWIFQELVLSRDPWVQCGSLRVRWADLCQLLLLTNPPASQPHTPGLNVLSSMNTSRRGGGGLDLFKLLQARRGLGATDPRDIIYAHYGIARDRNAWIQNVPVNYAQDVSRLYEDVAAFVLQTVGPNTLFGCVDAEDREGRMKGLASWAPDWTRQTAYNVRMYIDDLLNRKTLETTKYYVVTGNPKVLAYLGYEVDVVKDVSLILPSPDDLSYGAGGSEEYQEAIKAIMGLYAKNGGMYASGNEYGRYNHITLKGEAEVEEHTRLCRVAWDEWVRIFSEELPSLLHSTGPNTDAEAELKSNSRFVEFLKEWIITRSQRKMSFAGSGTQGLEYLMWTYLLPNFDQRALTGRRWATTLKNRIAIVPAQTKAGDVAAFIPGSEVCYVLHETAGSDRVPDEAKPALEEEIRAEFASRDPQNRQPKKPYVSSFEELFQEKDDGRVPMGYFELVGEGYVEGVVGWAVNEEQGHKVFVLV